MPVKGSFANFLTIGVLIASVTVTVTPSPSAECSSPSLTLMNGVRGTGSGYTVYKTQIVAVHGAGWASCTTQVGGCISARRAAPVSGIEVVLVRASGAASAPPETWKPSGPTRSLGTVDAQADYTFSIEQVTMPARHGHFLLMASSSEHPEPQTFGYVTIL